MKKKTSVWSQVSVHAFLSAGILTTLMPFIWMLSTSFKTQEAIFEYPPRLIPRHFSIQSYLELFRQLDFFTPLFNTIFVSVSYTAGALLITSMAAHVFAKFHFRGRDKLFVAVLATMMIPGQVTLIPNFLLIKTLGWLNSYQALIVPGLANVFNIFFLRQFMQSVPDELIEAARIDGAGEWRIFFGIMLPLIKPALATLGILNFIGMWNNFLWPAIIATDSRMYTLEVALYTLFGQNTGNTTFGVVMAGAVIVLLPLMAVFLLGQKYIINGIAFTGLKN